MDMQRWMCQLEQDELAHIEDEYISSTGVFEMAEQSVAIIQSFSNQQMEIMKATVAKELSNAEFAFFMEVCKHRGLNPFNREIYAFSSKGKLTIQVSIDGLRLIAERSGKYKGQIGPFYCAEDGVWVDVWLSKTPPCAAKVGVKRAGFDEPIWAVTRYESYANLSSPIWQKMPDLMLAKCAESLALRRAFPAEMGGLYSHDEMEQSGNVVVNAIAPNSQRLNALYTKGKEKGLWESESGFCAFASAELNVNVSKDTIYELVEDQFLQLEQAIEEEVAVAQ
jgi:phage recombination protein Bet